MRNYNRKFGKFHYENTDSDWFAQLEEEIQQSLELPTRSMRYKRQKQRIFNKWHEVYMSFIDYANEVNPDEAVTWYHTHCIDDPELFALSYIRPDNGLPMFLLEWQSDMIYAIERGDYDRVYALQSRKLGKTAAAQAMLPFRMAKYKNEHVRVFAPQEGQLFVLNDIYDTIMRSDFLYNEFVMPKNDDLKHRGKINTEVIKFGRNWSDITGAGLAQNRGEGREGRSKTGAKGSFFFVDEWGQILGSVMRTVIRPMGADAFSKKIFVGFGTPTTVVNTELDKTWENIQNDPRYKTYSFDWRYGVKHGAITREYMRDDVFNDPEFNIPCPFGQKYGICGPYVLGDKSIRIDQKTGKLKYPGDEGYNEAWSCDESCYLNQHFVEEYCARFAEFTGNWWVMENVHRSGNPNLTFHSHPFPGEKYIIAIDWGRMFNATQVGIWAVMGRKIRLHNYKEFVPQAVSKDNSNTARPLFKAVREFVMPFDDQTMKYYWDITGDKNGLFGDLLLHGYDNIPGFPKSKIVRNSTAEKNNTWGLWCANDIFNSDLKQNLKTQFMAHNIEVPMVEPFWSNYIWEFEHCKVEPTGSGHLTFKEPKNGRRAIDILDMTSFAAWHLFHKREEKPYYGISVGYVGGRKKEPSWKNREE